MQCPPPAGQHLMVVVFPSGFAIIDKFSFVADLHRKIPKIPTKPLNLCSLGSKPVP